MKDIKDYIIPSTWTIQQAVVHLEQVIDDFGTLFVIDGGKFIGTLEDGDIRRALMKEDLNIRDSVLKVVHRNPVVLRDNRKLVPEEISRLKRYKFVPRVNENGEIAEFLRIDDYSVRLPNRAVIMAGGRGSRLGKLTENTPKPMLTVGSKPILEIIIEQLRDQNIKDLYISVNFNAEMIKNHFGDGQNFGVRISYLEEKNTLGTAGCLSLIGDELHDPFVVMNGDILTDVAFPDLLGFHVGRKFRATIGAVEHHVAIPFGVIETDDGACVKELAEKPTKSYLVSAGIYALDPFCLSLVPKDSFFDMPTLFNTLLSRNEATGVYRLPGFWLDIGSPEDFVKADLAYEAHLRSKR